MKAKKDRAAKFLQEFKGDNYIFGLDCFDHLGRHASPLGQKASVVISGLGQEWAQEIHRQTRNSLQSAGIQIAGDLIAGARPNSPKEDIDRIAESLRSQQPELVISVGGGSGIDAVKAALCRLALQDDYPDINDYLGVDSITRMLDDTRQNLVPLVCAQLAASSAAHLTKYANITDTKTHQKMLIVDDAIVPERTLFDYKHTRTMSRDFTMDGGLDGVAHCLEVYFGIPEDKLMQLEPVALLGIELIVGNLKQAIQEPDDLDAREALGLGTDLGGYAIMIGGTNGAHLTSFSLVDLLSHGRACALMNPYYTVFFAPAIEDRVRKVGKIYQDAGYTNMDLDKLQGRDLGLAVAEAMVAHSEDVGFPTRLKDVKGFTDQHIERCLTAAKNPKLKMKLENMPVALNADMVDDYMGSILEAAKLGDFSLVRNIA